MNPEPAHVVHTDADGDVTTLVCQHPMEPEIDGWVGRHVTDAEMAWIVAHPDQSGWDEDDLEADIWLGTLPDGAALVVDCSGAWHVVTAWCCAAGYWELEGDTPPLKPSATYVAYPEWWDTSCIVKVGERVDMSDG